VGDGRHYGFARNIVHQLNDNGMRYLRRSCFVLFASSLIFTTYLRIMASPLKNIVVVGASYVGRVSLHVTVVGTSNKDTDRTILQGAALELAKNVPSTHRVSQL
jgi:hypothetical protein